MKGAEKPTLKLANLLAKLISGKKNPSNGDKKQMKNLEKFMTLCKKSAHHAKSSYGQYERSLSPRLEVLLRRAFHI